MTTEWFNRTVGAGVAVHKDDPTMLLLHDPQDKPDWVALPDELGGGRFRCSKVVVTDCPCGRGHQARHLVLEGTDLGVAECKHDGFLWYRGLISRPDGNTNNSTTRGSDD